MEQRSTLQTAAMIVLLLPGLVMAASTPGACGHCDESAPCASMQAPEPEPKPQSCCDEDKTQAPETATPGLSECDCGREPPPAVSADAAPITRPGGAVSSAVDHVLAPVVVPVAVDGAERPPAPPDSPPFFLIDCAFLT